jgi:hypothetical protein
MEICGSEFLSAIGGVSVLFAKADEITKDGTHFSRLTDKPANNTVFFWLEAARMFSGGKQNYAPLKKYPEMKLFLNNFGVMENLRYSKAIREYDEYLELLTPVIP